MKQWQIGDRVQLRGYSIQGTVTGVKPTGTIGVQWDDGDETPLGGIHPADVDPA